MKDSVKHFVTREHVQFTNEEITAIINNLKNQFANNKYGIKFKRFVAHENSLHTLEIIFDVPHYVGRCADNGRFELFGISFVLWKAKGEIEISFRDNIYEPFDGVCYSGDICFHANWIKYKCRHVESYQKVCPYAYGDDITDLNYTKVIKQLYEDLKNCKVAE